MTTTPEEQPTFTIKPTDDGYEMMVELPQGAPLFKTANGLSHRVVLDGPKGGVLSSAYGAAMQAFGYYKPERSITPTDNQSAMSAELEAIRKRFDAIMSAELEAIRKRFDAIIPGPWRWYGNTATDQVFLATRDRGRLFIMTVNTRATEYVYHHSHVATYDKASISNTQVQDWCGAHDEFGGDDDKDCICEDIAAFLAEGREAHDGPAYFDQGGVALTRSFQVHADVRFPVAFGGHGMEPLEHKKLHGGTMQSYRHAMPKYEVLGYRTASEWEADQGGVQNAQDALYREDFTGLDNPEAEFIARAPEDIGWLLARVAELEAEVADRAIEDYKDAL